MLFSSFPFLSVPPLREVDIPFHAAKPRQLRLRQPRPQWEADLNGSTLVPYQTPVS
nr:MAG TPA: hypothetical protein [Caudoviricetes sp.]